MDYSEQFKAYPQIARVQNAPINKLRKRVSDLQFLNQETRPIFHP